MSALGNDTDFTQRKLELTFGSMYYWEKFLSNTTTIIMLHGFTGNHAGLVATGRLIKGARVIIPDLPGFGISDMPNEPHNIESLANSVAEFIKALKLKTPPILHGHSLGSIIATRIAVNYPNLIDDTLILQNATAKSSLSLKDGRMAGVLISSAYYWLGARTKFGKALVDSKAVSVQLTHMIASTENPELLKKIEDHHISDLKYVRHKYYSKIYNSIIKLGVNQSAPKITQKVMLISGVKDVVTPVKHQRELVSELKQGRLYEIDGVGHLTHFETPEKVAEYISSEIIAIKASKNKKLKPKNAS